MTTNPSTFQVTFSTWLKKVAAFSARELEALVAILSCVIGNPTFRLNRVAKAATPGFSRNFLATSLMKYAYVQQKLATFIFTEIVTPLPKRLPILLVLDDTLVKKCGKHIHGAYAWYDHTCGRRVTSLCLVNLALVVNHQLVFVLPWLLRRPASAQQPGSISRKDQDAKTLAACELLRIVRSRFKQAGISEKRIVVEADAWYGNKTFQSALKQTEGNFRLDARRNLLVQVPDQAALATRGQRRRGRTRQKFVRYLPLTQFLGNSNIWHWFTARDTGERIYYQMVILTLKTDGKVRVYAFWRESCGHPKYILTRALNHGKPTAQLVYDQYQQRWSIETAHRDLKQQFGLTKCQARESWVVSGFIGLIYLGYNLWRVQRWQTQTSEKKMLKCPSWAEQFYQEQIITRIVASS